MINLILWKPQSVFDTYFNKVCAFVTKQGNENNYCHAESVFTFTKQEWKDKLLAFDKNYGNISIRAKSLWARMEAASGDIDNDAFVSLCFYTIWGSRLSVRLLTQYDEYVFNRLPDPQFTESLHLDLTDEELRTCLAFSLQELDKEYDPFKAILYFLPPVLINRPESPNLPKKYFCSEFICYMIKQLGYLKDSIPEKVTPNHIPGLFKKLEREIKMKRAIT